MKTTSMKQLCRSILPFLLIALALSACKTRPASGSNFANGLDPEVKSACAEWKQDKFGCGKMRTAPKGEAIFAAFHALKPTEAEIEDLLGPAEAESSFNGRKSLDYFFDTQCQNGKMTPNTVYCVLQFKVSESTGKLEVGGVVCG